jgi:hypothetical protein
MLGHRNGAGNHETIWQRMVAGAMAGTTAVFATFPLDFIRTRLSAQAPGRESYSGMMDAVRKIYHREGPLAFYRGIGVSCLVILPNFITRPFDSNLISLNFRS